MIKAPLENSPVFGQQAKAGASFIDYAGWQIADHYGNPTEEHLAVRHGVGLIDLSHRGKIRVEGRDRTTFLHAMLSNDIKNLKSGEGLYAAMLNAQGRILADLYLYASQEHFLIDCSASLTKKIVETLNQYIIMEKVTLKDETRQYAFLAVEGPEAISLVKKIAGEDLSYFKLNAHKRKNLAGSEAEIFRCSLSGEQGFAVLVEAQAAPGLWDSLLAEGKSFGIRPFGRAAANTLRLEAGIPWYGIDMDESNLLPETGLEHAVSYTKGCYIGQEVVARLQAIAQVNKKLMGLEISSGEVPSNGAKLLKEAKKIGYLTSAVFSPTLRKAIALGYVHRNHAAKGTALQVEHQGKKVEAYVTTLPFFLRNT